MVGYFEPTGSVWPCLAANLLQTEPFALNYHCAHVPDIQQLKPQADPVDTPGIMPKNVTREKMLSAAKNLTFCWTGPVWHSG